MYLHGQRRGRPLKRLTGAAYGVSLQAKVHHCGLGLWPRWYGGTVSDDSAAEVAYAAIVALYINGPRHFFWPTVLRGLICVVLSCIALPCMIQHIVMEHWGLWWCSWCPSAQFVFADKLFSQFLDIVKCSLVDLVAGSETRTSSGVAKVVKQTPFYSRFSGLLGWAGTRNDICVVFGGGGRSTRQEDIGTHQGIWVASTAGYWCLHTVAVMLVFAQTGCYSNQQNQST